MESYLDAAREVIRRCQSLAECTEESGYITRPFLSESMHEVHARLRRWMGEAGLTVSIDSVGNLRGFYAAGSASAPRLLIGSHLDTVPRAGAYDGILGVVSGVAMMKLLRGRRLKFGVEVIGFSEEEGVRFGLPFISSRALIGELDDQIFERRDSNGITVADAIRSFGIKPGQSSEAQVSKDAFAYFELHIEQGPVLESLALPLGVVEAIVGQTRALTVFSGHANHAGTTPMELRQDALTGAAEWIGFVEGEARGTPGLVATVGRVEVEPGAVNAVPGLVRASLDVRHANDEIRRAAVARIRWKAEDIGKQRKLAVSWEERLDESSVAMDSALIKLVEKAVDRSSHRVHRMNSGAGHDAMVVARRLPVAMLFVRSPRGLSHHPDETVLVEDVAAALHASHLFLEELGSAYV
jgi:allantoate deiminase